jgi:glycine cleavage system regulatory protein
MRTSLVVTVISDDRPGIVEELSEQVLAAGGNWEESRMARLAGKFAGLLRVSVDAERADALAAALAGLRRGGLTVVAEPGFRERLDGVPPSGVTRAEEFRAFALQVFGSDQPGIVRDISRVLAQHGVNIEELETEVTSAPMSGETLFHARAQLGIPATMSGEQLRTVLETIANDLMVDVTLAEERPADPSS